MRRSSALLLLILLLPGCVSSGTVGVITKSGADPLSLVSGEHPFVDMGPAHARSCRFFVLSAIPFGDSTLSTAVEDALATTGGDALLNATVSSSLFGFVPLYNLLAYTCTSVKGTAIQFESSAPESPL